MAFRGGPVNVFDLVTVGLFAVAWLGCMVSWIQSAYYGFKFLRRANAPFIHYPRIWWRTHSNPAAEVYRHKAFRSIIRFMAFWLGGVTIGAIGAWHSGHF